MDCPKCEGAADPTDQPHVFYCPACLMIIAYPMVPRIEGKDVYSIAAKAARLQAEGRALISHQFTLSSVLEFLRHVDDLAEEVKRHAPEILHFGRILDCE